MKTLPAGLKAQLESGVTTLCRCWLLVRTDGIKLGFTDHDRDLVFDGTTFEALSGINAGAVNATDALNIDTVEIAGALQSDHFNEADLVAGLYDNAALTLFLVNWADPADRDIVFAGSIGEVSRGRTHFSAEMRGLSHALNQQTGRVYGASCDADLGDARCGIDLTAPEFKGGGIVSAVNSDSSFAATGLDVYASGLFARGRLLWTAGANAGAAMEVKFHVNNGAVVAFELWETMPFPIAAGDTFDVTAGCDKSLGTCKDTFDNVVNYRGFPFIPGNDVLISYPGINGRNDGGSRG